MYAKFFHKNVFGLRQLSLDCYPPDYSKCQVHVNFVCLDNYYRLVLLSYTLRRKHILYYYFLLIQLLIQTFWMVSRKFFLDDIKVFLLC